jgi:hypothetical protein
MSTKLSKIVADFTTSLATAISVGGTSATLQSATDDDGVSLPAGTYYFTIDGDNSQKEHIQCSLSGTSLTSIKTVTRQGTITSGAARAHRVGASVRLTDFAVILYMKNLLDGTDDLNASTPLKYDGTASISNANHLATKDYVDGVAIAGGADASTTVKGITKLSTAPASATNPIAVGDNDTRVPSQDENNALAATTTPSSSNLFVTQKDLQKSAEVYAADAGANDTYAITLSPAPAAYTTGMVVRFKANTGNTGAATLNVNSLGAKTIKKFGNTDLSTGDITAGQIAEVIYDGTNFQIMDIQQPAPSIKTGLNTSRAMNTASGNLVIAHGLSSTPRFVRITAGISGTVASTSIGTYNGSTTSCIYSGSGGGSDASNIVYLRSDGASPNIQSATVSVDSTNITLAFTKSGSNGTETIGLMWEAFA